MKTALVVACALVGVLLLTGLAAGQETVDGPDGFSAQVLAPHATFPDHVAAQFRVKHGKGRTLVSNLQHDASSVVVARVTWEPGGRSGWHTHPGPVIVSVVQGKLDVVNAFDCVVHAYKAGEAFLDPGQGNVHIAINASDTEPAVAYATFLGVPAGTPATHWVQPADCARG